MKKHDDLKAAIIILGILSILFIFYFLHGWAGRAEYVAAPYTVVAGDTLDGLYYQYGGGGLEKWRHEVRKINRMEDSCLYIGDEILILTQADTFQGSHKAVGFVGKKEERRSERADAERLGGSEACSDAGMR